MNNFILVSQFYADDQFWVNHLHIVSIHPNKRGTATIRLSVSIDYEEEIDLKENIDDIFALIEAKS